MRQLYEDLKTTNVNDLLDISKPAFQFVEPKRFKECIKWEDVLLKAVKDSVETYKVKVVAVLSILLPRLADGFFVQRGDVFGFGNLDPNSSKLVTKHAIQSLNKAPIHHLDSERSVGSINYELGIRGATEINAASTNFVKSKSYDLVELRPAEEYKKYENAAKKVNNLVREWKEKQLELEKEGMSKKMVESIIILFKFTDCGLCQAPNRSQWEMFGRTSCGGLSILHPTDS
jgi:hypothetical protein